MKVLALVHRYPPLRPAGAEMMLHAILLDLAKRGHDVAVLYAGARVTNFEGVPVAALASTERRQTAQVADVDVVLTHLDATPIALRVARTAGKPLVHLVHNDKQLRFNKVPLDAALVAFNSLWLARREQWPGPSLILRPHVEVDRYMVHGPRSMDRADIALVNLTAAKGAALFYEVAASMLDRSFLAVRGGYGEQLHARSPNVNTVRCTGQIVADVYARARLVLMPSHYESWGRVAIEAACSGIPTIAAPTPGLKESLGRAGIFAPLRNAQSWRWQIERLDDAAEYAKASERALRRAVELERVTQADLNTFAAALESL